MVESTQGLKAVRREEYPSDEEFYKNFASLSRLYLVVTASPRGFIELKRLQQFCRLEMDCILKVAVRKFLPVWVIAL